MAFCVQILRILHKRSEVHCVVSAMPHIQKLLEQLVRLSSYYCFRFLIMDAKIHKISDNCVRIE